MKHAFFSLLAAGIALSHPLHAQQGGEVPDFVLAEVVVTVTRSEARLLDLPRKVEVISQLDLERTVSEDLATLLKNEAAVDVIEYPGLLAGIGVRGFRPEFSGINRRTLLLIDGRPAGASNLATFDLSGLERIEILKGPGSALYGSSAMGGVVNLIPRRSRDQLHGSLTAGYGSFQTSEFAARMGGRLSEGIDLDAGFRRFQRGADFRIGGGNTLRGIFGEDRAVKLYPDGTTREVPEVGDGVRRENSRYDYWSGDVRLGVEVGGGWRMETRGELFTADGVETPGDLTSETPFDGRKNLERRSWQASLGGELGVHRLLARLFRGEQSTDFFNLFADPPFVSFVGGEVTKGLQLQDEIRLPPGSITAGLDVTGAVAEGRSFADADTPRAPFSPDYATGSVAVFAEGRFHLFGDRLTTTLGGRFDRVSLELLETPLRGDVEPGEETFYTFNPSAGLQLRVAEGLRLRSTVGRAFVAPNAFTRAGLAALGEGSGSVSLTIGNPAVKPERSVTNDLGVDFRRPLAGVEAGVTLFSTRVEERITSVFAFFPEGERPFTEGGDEVRQLLTYVNAAGASMRGVEWNLAYDLGARFGYPWSLRLFANATHMLAAEESAAATFVDSGRFAAGDTLRPEEVFEAVVFGDPVSAEIKNVAGLNLNYGAEYDDLERWYARLSGRYVGERLDTDFSDFSDISDIRYPPAMTLDLAAGLRWGGRYRADLAVTNLTDENVYEVRGFNLPGRSLRLALTAEF
ncbi:MAG: TonB-dependent receptor [Longimicrobiaceae bacterium]